MNAHSLTTLGLSCQGKKGAATVLAEGLDCLRGSVSRYRISLSSLLLTLYGWLPNRRVQPLTTGIGVDGVAWGKIARHNVQ